MDMGDMSRNESKRIPMTDEQNIAREVTTY